MDSQREVRPEVQERETNDASRHFPMTQTSSGEVGSRTSTRTRGSLSSRVRARTIAWLSSLTLGAACVLGVVSFAFPFLSPPDGAEQGGMTLGAMSHATDAPLLLILMIVLCLGAILSNLQGKAMNSKTVAVLGILTAINAALRAIPGPAGFAAVFMLPVLCGYTYGASFGFLLGALSLLVSALLGAGVGPWLPFQMFATGWVGMSSAWLPKMRRWPRGEVVLLAIWGVVWGLLFGAIMNIWFWPYVYQPHDSGIYWQPGTAFLESLRRYVLFYATTSLWWDLGRAGGNFALLILFGSPLLRLLRRFGRRLQFEMT